MDYVSLGYDNLVDCKNSKAYNRNMIIKSKKKKICYRISDLSFNYVWYASVLKVNLTIYLKRWYYAN